MSSLELSVLGLEFRTGRVLELQLTENRHVGTQLTRFGGVLQVLRQTLNPKPIARSCVTCWHWQVPEW